MVGAMSLLDRVVGEAIGAAGSWDQTNPVGVSKQSRKVVGNFPLPLRRRREKGEKIHPDLFTEAKKVRLTKAQRRALEFYAKRDKPDPVINFPWRVHPTLMDLVRRGLLREHPDPKWIEKRKYSITDAGRSALGLTEQQPAPVSGWVTMRYPAGTKHAGRADVVIGKGGDRKRAKKVADALRWIYDKRVKTESETFKLTRAGECAIDQIRRARHLTWRQLLARCKKGYGRADLVKALRDLVRAKAVMGYQVQFPGPHLWLDPADAASFKLDDWLYALNAKSKKYFPHGPPPAWLGEDEAPAFKALKAGRGKLTPEERTKVMDSKAVWHSKIKRNPKTGKIVHSAVPAVWKSEVDGKTWYVTNTHRAYNVTTTLKGTIKRFHDFIKGTA